MRSIKDRVYKLNDRICELQDRYREKKSIWLRIRIAWNWTKIMFLNPMGSISAMYELDKCMRQLRHDEMVYGQSGVQVSADGKIRVIPPDELIDKIDKAKN